MSRDSPHFEKQLSKEIEQRTTGVVAGRLRWQRTVRRWLGPLTARVLWGGLMAIGILYLGAMLIGIQEDFRKPAAAFLGMAWMAGRGLWLANAFLAQVKFSTRSRALLALPETESNVITAALRRLRWQPLQIWIEAAVLIALGAILRNAEPGFPVVDCLAGATAALVATLGVANWMVLLSSFFRWNLPLGFLAEGRRFIGVFVCGLFITTVFGQIVVDPVADFLEVPYTQIHLIPLVGWTARWFDPIPGQPGPAVFFAATVIAALFPLLFARRTLIKGSVWLHQYAPALLATHWRSAIVSPPPSRSKIKPAADSQTPTALIQEAAAEPAMPRFRFIEDFAHQWFNEDERRAMTVHLGTPYPPWTRKALLGCGGLFAVIPVSALARAVESTQLTSLLSIAAIFLGVASLWGMLGGATPFRGLRVRRVGSFWAPLFAGWPVRVTDLINADWKTAVIRIVAALPVCVAVAFWLGSRLGDGSPDGAKAAVNMLAFLIVVTATRPLTFISSLSNSTKRPRFFSKVAWIILITGSPLIMLIVVLIGGSFVMLSLANPVMHFAGIGTAAAVFLPSLGLVWLHRSLFDRARISLETVQSK